MRIDDLRVWLTLKKIDPKLYSVGPNINPENDVYCLSVEFGHFEVFFAERGTKQGTRSFVTEEEACADFIRRIREDRFIAKQVILAGMTLD